MKQEEKSRLTYERILQAAIIEYGTNTYDNASVNRICSENHISKGLIYHHFKNKDQLYLSCVALCFEEITAFLKKGQYHSEDFNANMNTLMELRQSFFCKNPYFRNIFFQAILMPPSHLQEQICELKREFQEFNLEQYRNIIRSVILRKGISEKEALQYFFVLSEMFNGYYGNQIAKHSNFDSLVADHEIQLSKILNIILYGIVEGR